MKAAIKPETTNGPRPLFPMDPVQIIRGVGDRNWFVSFNGDNGHGPFPSRETAQAYADRATRQPTAQGGAA